MLPAVQNVWSLWLRTRGGGFTRFVSGMTIIPVGKIREAVISEARAMGIPWDDNNARWYGMVEDAWLADLAHKRERKGQ